jgi:inhibitor of cysteine peptidase
MRKILFIFLICFFAICYAAEKTPPEDFTRLPFTDPQIPIAVSEDSPVIIIKLQANPSTGYSWYLIKIKRKYIEPVSAKYFPPAAHVLGAPGYMIWKFKMKPAAFIVPRMVHFSLSYARTWDLSSAVESQFTVVTQSNSGF